MYTIMYRTDYLIEIAHRSNMFQVKAAVCQIDCRHLVVTDLVVLRLTNRKPTTDTTTVPRLRMTFKTQCFRM